MAVLKVLIIDDNEVARTMLGEMIVAFGHTVAAETDSLEKALEFYRVLKPDLVTLDLSMPENDGLTVLKAIRAQDPAAKVMIVSSTPETNAVYKELREAGAAAFLVKPFDLDDLQARLLTFGGGPA